jgi:hypothetical protein
MEALVERPGSTAPPTVPRIWSAEDQQAPGDGKEVSESGLGRRAGRALSVVLALLALLVLFPCSS